MELSGTWRAVVADEDLRRSWLDDGGPVDDDWEPVEVPGHWRSHAAFADANGPLLYRTRFEQDRPAEGERRWLRFDGLFYQGDVWLDGAYVGDTEGYFFPHCFEVTEALADRTEHRLGVEVACSPQTDRDPQAQPHRGLPALGLPRPRLEPRRHLAAGLHRDRPAPIRIQHLRVLCRRADATRADVAVRAVLDAAEGGGATITTTIGGTDHSQDVTLASGENQLEWTVAVAGPRLWWPKALGDQPLEDVTVEVTADGADRPSHRRTSRTGLRQVSMRAWVVSVNGERLFVKGANHGPHAHGARRGEPPRRCAATSTSPSTAASTCCGCTRTSPGPSSTTRPTRPASSCGRTCPCSGATRAASASRPCARPARRWICSATTRRW